MGRFDHPEELVGTAEVGVHEPSEPSVGRTHLIAAEAGLQAENGVRIDPQICGSIPDGRRRRNIQQPADLYRSAASRVEGAPEPPMGGANLRAPSSGAHPQEQPRIHESTTPSDWRRLLPPIGEDISKGVVERKLWGPSGGGP